MTSNPSTTTTTTTTTSTTTTPLLSVQDLVVTVAVDDQDVPAIRGVSFEISAGQSLGLVGESGCGKSLTALSIMRLCDTTAVRTHAGQILLRGEDLVKASEQRLCTLRGRALGMVFQDAAAALNPVTSVGRQIAEPLRRHRNLSRQSARAHVVRLLDSVGIPQPEARARAFPHELSGGMKQRALIAMALSCDPDVLIADEPTTALDVTIQAQILELLDRQRRDRNMAMLFVSHDLAVVARVCDNIAVMYAGRIVERAPTNLLLATPRHPYTRGLLDAMGSVDAGDPRAENGRESTDSTDARPVLREIPGTVPSLRELALKDKGCAFADRCERVQDRCWVETPPATMITPDHLLHCHNPVPVQ